MTSAGVPMAGVTADDRLPGASPSRLSPVARTAIVAMLLLVGMADLVVLDAIVLPRTLAHEVRPAPVVPAPSAPALPSAVPVGLAPAPAPVAQELPTPVEPAANPPEALPALLFRRNAAVLRKDARATLERLLAVMTARPGFHVRLNGHTDDIGTERFNNLLSWHRARAAQEWLVAQGVDRARIEAQGFGASKPLGGAIIPSARPQNRRVEIEFR